MKGFFKKLFCRHIYKLEKEEFLETKRDSFGSDGFHTTYANYDYYALYKKCLKCGKEKIFSKRLLKI